MSDLLTFVVVGLATGSIYALAATGLVVTYRTSGVFNFAHGSIATIGAYVFYVALEGVPAPVAVLATVVGVGVVVGSAFEWVTRQVRASTYSAMVVTIGAVLLVQGVVWATVGTDARFVRTPLPAGSLRIPFTKARVSTADVALVFAGACVVFVLDRLVNRTRAGLLMRAVVDNPVLAARSGISADAVRRGAWVVGAAFAALAGVLLAPLVTLEPVVLASLVVQSFGAAALGGFRRLGRTYLGALAIGVVASLAGAYLTTPSLTSVPSAVPYLVLVGVLVLAPPRELRERVTRGVRLARPASSLRVANGALLIGAVVAAGLPYASGTRTPIAIAACASVIVFLGLSLITNLAGHLSLCHAALAALGATAFANLAAVLPWGFALIGGALVVVPVAIGIALVAARLSELALAIVSFGLANVLFVAAYGTAWMFGRDGTRLAPRPSLFASDTRYLGLAAALAVACCALVAALNRSRAGRVFRALAVAPETLEALGVSAATARGALFTIAGLFAGLGGAVAAAGNLSASRVGYPPTLSLLWVAALAFGGRGVVSGAVRAGLAVVLVPYVLDPFFGDHTLWLFGLVAIGVAVLSTRRAPVLA